MYVQYCRVDVRSAVAASPGLFSVSLEEVSLGSPEPTFDLLTIGTSGECLNACYFEPHCPFLVQLARSRTVFSTTILASETGVCQSFRAHHH